MTMRKASIRKASIKETGEEISQADWARFDAAVARAKAERAATGYTDVNRSNDAGIRHGFRGAPPSSAPTTIDPDREG